MRNLDIKAYPSGYKLPGAEDFNDEKRAMEEESATVPDNSNDYICGVPPILPTVANTRNEASAKKQREAANKLTHDMSDSEKNRSSNQSSRPS